jgi:hypothetical protein
MPDADPSKWLPLEIVARAMFAAAFAPQGSGPMFPVGKEG